MQVAFVLVPSNLIFSKGGGYGERTGLLEKHYEACVKRKR